jgi:tetratricopeptide (TPR) repeat protein
LHTERRTLDEAIRQLKLAQELDPFSLQPHQALSGVYWVSRDYEKAIAEAETILKMDPNNAEAHGRISDVYLTTRQYDKAVAEYELFLVALGAKKEPMAVHQAYLDAGYKSWLRKRIDLAKNRSVVDEGDVAQCYAVLGDKDQAFFWLNKGYEDREAGVFYLGVIPLFDSLRSDPRFADLLRRMGLPQHAE